MKKLLIILGAIGLTIVPASLAVVSCDWKIPPIPTSDISKIMEKVSGSKDEVTSFEMKGSKIDTDKIEEMYKKEDTEKATIAKGIFDPLAADVNTLVLEKIKSGKDIQDKDIKADLETIGYDTDKLSKFQAYYFTVRIADVKLTTKPPEEESKEGDNGWLSQTEGAVMSDATFFNEKGDKDGKMLKANSNQEKLESELSNRENVSLVDINSLDKFLDDNGNILGEIKEAYYLVSINPNIKVDKEAKAIAFYVKTTY